MRTIDARTIEQAVASLCRQANTVLRPDVLSALKHAYLNEINPAAKDILEAVIKNASVARREGLALCQDTGLPCVFVEAGQEVAFVGDITKAINRGIAAGYRKGYLRNSIVRNPLVRGRSVFTPAIVHFDIVRGSTVKLTVLPKGFGCENKSRLKMFLPTAPLDEINDFIVNAVKEAGPDACPPYIVGVGIGGTADYAALLAKKALLLKVTRSQGHRVTRMTEKLERDLEARINKLDIGPMGLGGRSTVLAVRILTYPTHIAGLPVAVNISCHSLRSASAVL